MANQIVTLNVSQTQAPTPNTLLKMGAFISMGATSLSAGSYSLLTQQSSLATLFAPALALASLSWSGGTVLATAAAPLTGWNVGDTFLTTIAGATPTGYNGLVLATVTGTTTFTYPLAVNPGAETVAGTFTPGNQGELSAMNTTFWSQGSSVPVYVLELGPADGATGPTALSAWIAANPGVFYSYLVPASWDAQTSFGALIAQFESLTAKTQFWVTTTLNTYAFYTAQMNDVWALIQAPAAPATEFTCAAPFYVSLNYAPSSTNKMTPFAFSYVYGVTAYPTQGNSTLLANLKAANINVIGLGSEGGISNTILFWGTTMDGMDFTWWYSIDWAQINCDLAVANAVINGSNNPLAPMLFNQQGINVLQQVATQTLKNAVTYGLATGTVVTQALDPNTFATNVQNGTYPLSIVINAVPFLTYTTQNPSAYKQGIYGGLQAVYIPSVGFKIIIFNINVTSILTQ